MRIQVKTHRTFPGGWSKDRSTIYREPRSILWRRFEEDEALKVEIAIIEGLQARDVFAKLGARVDDYLADLRRDLAEERAKEQKVIAATRQ